MTNIRFINTENRYQNRAEFKQIATVAIKKALDENKIYYGPGESGRPSANGIKPDYSVIIGGKQPILDWWFDFKQVKHTEDPIKMKQKVKHYLEHYICLDAEPSRKITVVVDDVDTFYALEQLRNHLSYRGDLSVMLLDNESYTIRREVYLAHYREDKKSEFIVA